MYGMSMCVASKGSSSVEDQSPWIAAGIGTTTSEKLPGTSPKCLLWLYLLGRSVEILKLTDVSLL